MASKFLGDDALGVPMNPYTHKLIVPLKEWQVSAINVLPVGAI